ncbi:putative ribonuclease H-like domain-containing protein [Tanacetum coccineum]
MFFCFLSQEEPKRVTKALSDSAWVEAMQEELLQFKLHKVWVLVDLPKGKRAIGTKWIFINKKDEKGIVIRNKERLVAQGYTPSRTGSIRLRKEDVPYVKSAFLYGQNEEEVYVCQSLGFEDPDYPDKRKDRSDLVYQKAKGGYFACTESLRIRFLHVKQKEDGIFISQDKYVTDILKKFGFQDVRTASTPMDTEKPLLKDSDGDDVDVYLYRSMIGSLMYLTSSRPDIIYLKGQPKLGLWYPRDSPFDLVAYSDSDYAGASLDRKSTTGGCQFLGCRLISWQCKKQTMVATSSTEAEYVVAASCCGQVGDEAVHKELGDRMERAATTATSLEVEQDSGNINRTQSMATLNEPSH